MSQHAAQREPTLVPSNSWPDLVFHVLAHVARSAHLPASIYDPIYVGFVEQRLGPARERPLGEDAVVLGRVIRSHEALARVQLLAWLFDSVEQASACARRDLGALGSSDVAEPALLAPLALEGPPVEILRCAAELERAAYERLPAAPVEHDSLAQALRDAAGLAPGLRGAEIMALRALRLRGRVRGSSIWVGVPCADPGPDLGHVLWQAKHEATVREIGLTLAASGAQLAERSVEAVAVVLLAQRAVEAGRGAEHACWLDHLASPKPSIDPAALDPAELHALAECRRSNG